jgi:putative PIN family toxin of toxin-antitoxin system
VKIIIDTNLWISYLISERLKGLKDLCFDENISVFYCDEIIEEFIRISNKPRIRKRNVDDENVSFVLNLIRIACIKATFKDTAGYIVRDPKDAYLLALADAVNANFLLTGDNDLLVLESHNITRIISYSEFMNQYYEL